MKKVPLFFLLFYFIRSISAQVNEAGFTMHDSVCGSNTLLLNNTSNYGATNYWWSCTGQQNFTLQQSGTNLTGLGLVGPVRMSLAHDASGYYGFVTNHFGVTLSRINFGNSFQNTPSSAINMGNFGGIINDRPEGINILYDSLSGHWFGYMVCALDADARLISLDFGRSLANTPVATNLGNFNGIINFGHGIDIFNYGGTWIGFVINAFGNNLARLNFGTSLANVPVVTDLGNLANFNYPTTIKLLENNGTWYGFVTSMANESFIILNFGNSPLNTPTGTNLGNLGVLLAPFDFKIFSYCDTIVGYISDHSRNALYEVKFSPVDMSIDGTPTVALTGPFSTNEGMSEPFRSNDSLFWYVVNVGSASLTKVFFSNCNSLTGPYLNFDPPGFRHTDDMSSISLTVDEGRSTQQTICKNLQFGGGGVSAGVITAPDSICAGQSAQLSLNGNSAGNIQWQSSNTGSNYTNINDTSGTYTTSVSQTTYYRVYLYSGTCTDTSAPFKVVVSPVPSPALTVGDSAFCAGDSAHICTGNNYSSFNWNTGDTTACIYAKATGNYWVSVTGAGGCTATSPNQGIIVNPLPEPGLYANDSIICSSDSARICVNGNYTSIAWNTGETTACIYAKNAGGYWVNVTDSKGCKAVSGHQKLTVLPVPSVSIVVQGDTLYSYDAISYQWYLNGQPIPGATSPVYIAPIEGNYSIRITDTSGCNAVSNTFYISTATKDLPGNSSFEIYPVPAASGSFNIRYTGMGSATFKMALFNMLGEEVMQDNMNFTTGKTIPVNAPGLAKGTYLLQLQSANEIYTRRVVIM